MVTREDIDIYENEINELVNNIFNGDHMIQYSDVVGSFTGDIVRAFSTELLVQQNLYKELSKNYNAETAEGIYLDAICEEDYIFRKQALAATGNVKIYGTAGTVIKTGTQIASENCTYTVKKDTVIPFSSGTIGNASALVEADIAGTIGNASVGEINRFVERYEGLEKVENEISLVNGKEAETDEELRNRRKGILATPSLNYNAEMIKKIILENFSDIRKVKVVPRFNGKGSAKIVAVNNENNALTQSRMDNIKSFLDTEIVTDAEFTITTINNKVVNLDITAEIFDEYDEKSTKELIKNTLNKYFLDNLFKKEKLFYTSIIDELVEIEAFKDVFDVKLENAKENIDLSDEDLVTLGNINLIIKNK